MKKHRKKHLAEFKARVPIEVIGAKGMDGALNGCKGEWVNRCKAHGDFTPARSAKFKILSREFISL